MSFSLETQSAALFGLALVIGSMTLLWVASLVRRDVSLVDRFWGLAFVLLAWFYYLSPAHPGEVARQLLVPVLVTVWGLRLSIYLTWRNWGDGEDTRYTRMREQTDGFAWKSLFRVFWLQAVIAWIVAMPLLQVALTPRPEKLGWLDTLGLAFFATGLFFETVGDLQLARFKADPESRGEVLDSGLWRYTRHPNYFGDAMVWWGLALFALATPGALWSLIGPALMTFLLLKVSGVALLEKDLEKRKPAYREYVRKTSAFFPRPPAD